MYFDFQKSCICVLNKTVVGLAWSKLTIHALAVSHFNDVIFIYHITLGMLTFEKSEFT